MRLLGLLLCGLLLISCRTAEEKNIERIKEGQARASAKKQNAMMMELLRTELAVNGGLVVEHARVLPDSVVFNLTLSEEAISTWEKATQKLGRPPLLAWATVSAEVSLPGEEPTTYQVRLSGFGNLGPNRPTTRITLPKRPARSSGDSPLLDLPEGAVLQCSVLAVRVK
jgi:hypothetical protein